MAKGSGITIRNVKIALENIEFWTRAVRKALDTLDEETPLHPHDAVGQSLATRRPLIPAGQCAPPWSRGSAGRKTSKKK